MIDNIVDKYLTEIGRRNKNIPKLKWTKKKTVEGKISYYNTEHDVTIEQRFVGLNKGYTGKNKEFGWGITHNNVWDNGSFDSLLRAKQSVESQIHDTGQYKVRR